MAATAAVIEKEKEKKGAAVNDFQAE